MYRIELSPTEETVFRSIEELAVAIKRGVVTPRARIFHNASNRWLPIQFHPHYKAALSLPLTQAALVAGPPVKPLSSLSLAQPAEPEPPLPEPSAAMYAPQVEAPVTRKAAKPKTSKSSKQSRRAAKPRRQLRIALVGALLIGGAQWVLSAPLFSRAADSPGLLRLQRHLIATPTEAMQRISSPNSAAMMPVAPNSPTAAAPVRLEGVSEAYPNQTPSFGGTATAATEPPEIQQAPSSTELGSAPAADSLRVKMADSTSSKALKGVLRSVSGAQPPGTAASRR